MPRKRYKPEEIVAKLRQVDVLMSQGQSTADALRRGLGHLQESQFLYEMGLFPDLEYTFKHALTHEVTYGSLLRDRRRTLHGRIVETIEPLYPDRVPERVERLATMALQRRVEEGGRLRPAGRRRGVRAVGQLRGAPVF